MAISKNTQANIDDSNLSAYPNGQVKDDDGSGDGFPLIRATTSDYFETFDKLIRLANITFNGQFDNETNGFQYVAALIALASKSDYILALTTSGGVLNIATKLGVLNLNEKLIVQAASDWTTETNIIGSDSINLTVSITRQYKAGDYLMMIKTSGGVTLVCIITADNLNVVVSENSYLKAANNAVTIGGTVTNQAVTPASLLYAITQYLTNATNAAPFYATDSTPGLLSAADKTAIDGFTNPVKNVGWMTGVDPGAGTIGSFYTVNGGITAAQITAVYGSYYSVSGHAVGAGSLILCTMAVAMANTNYLVRPAVESLGTIAIDSISWNVTFQVVSTTQFYIAIREGDSQIQSLKIHCEVVQLT